jgi:hypothetical protein
MSFVILVSVEDWPDVLRCQSGSDMCQKIKEQVHGLTINIDVYRCSTDLLPPTNASHQNHTTRYLSPIAINERRRQQQQQQQQQRMNPKIVNGGRPPLQSMFKLMIKRKASFIMKRRKRQQKSRCSRRCK